MTKIVQTLTLQDEATPALEDIGTAAAKTAAQLDKASAALGKTATAEAAVGKAGKKAAEGFRSASEGSVIFTKQLDRNTRAYERLVHRYDEAAKVTHKVKEATKVFNAELKANRITQGQYDKQLALVTRGIEDQTLAARRGAAAQLSFKKVMERTLFVVKTYIAVMAVRAMGTFITGIIDARLALEQMQSTLLAATGSLAATHEAMGFVKDISAELGLVFQNTGIQYAKFIASTRNTKLQDQAQDIFRGFSKASVALRMSSAETEGVFRALIQMISKGNVQAEELRGQLGERLPGAFRAAADAIGVTTMTLNDMLEAGEVVAEDLVPKMAAAMELMYGAEAQKAAESMQGRINALSNAWFEFKAQVALGTVGDTASGAANWFTLFIEDMTRGMKVASDGIDKFQAKRLGVVEAYENLNRVDLDTLISEVERSKIAIFQWVHAMQQTNDAVDLRKYGALITLTALYTNKLMAAIDAQNGVTEAIEESDDALIKSSNAMTRLTNKYDPLFKITQKYDEELGLLSEATATQSRSQEFLTQAYIDAHARYEKARRAALGLDDANKKLTKSTKSAAAEQAKIDKDEAKARQLKLKQDQAQEKSDLGLKRQLDINEARRNGVRDITDITNALSLLQVQRQANATATANKLTPEARDTFVGTQVAAESARQDNKFLADQQKSYDALASDAEKYAIALDKINKLHETGTPAAIESIRRLNIEYAHLMKRSDQIGMGLTEGLKAYGEEAADVFSQVKSAAENSMTSIEDSILDMVSSGKFAIGDLVDSILADFARIAVRQAITGPLASAFGSAVAGSFGGGAAAGGGGLSGSTTGGTPMFASQQNFAGGFRTGGAFTIPGTGATDSKLVAFRGAPGERVTIDPVTGPKGERGSGGGDMIVNVYDQADGTEVRQERSRTPGGAEQLDIYIENVVSRSISNNGQVGRSIDQSRGTRTQGIVR